MRFFDLELNFALFQLAKEIVQNMKKSDEAKINFQGFFVGDPVTDPIENTKGRYDTWYGHQLVSLTTYLNYVNQCNDGVLYYTQNCANATQLMSNEIGNGIDFEGLDYPLCKLNRTNNSTKYGDDKITSLFDIVINFNEKLSPVYTLYYINYNYKM